MPAFYYNFCPENFSKGALKKINVLLRKFSAVAWNSMSRAVGEVTPDIKKVIEYRFNSFKSRAFRQNLIDLYDNKKDLQTQDQDHPLAKWHGLNRYSVSSLLSASLKKKHAPKFVLPFSDENLDTLQLKIEHKQNLIISKIQEKSNKKSQF